MNNHLQRQNEDSYIVNQKGKEVRNHLDAI